MKLQRSFKQSAVYSLWHLHRLSAVCQFRKVNFLKYGGVRPSYGAKAIADCHIPELMKFRKVIFWRLKNAGKSMWLDKAILQIVKPLKLVFCSSCDGVPLKFKNKNGRASSLTAQIIWAYYWTLLEFAGQYLWRKEIKVSDKSFVRRNFVQLQLLAGWKGSPHIV